MARIQDTLKPLKYVAVYGGILAIGGATYFTLRLQSNFRNQEFYKKSVDLLNGYKAAHQLLGKPIHCKRLDLGDTTKNYSDGYNARLTVPLRGPKAKGVLHSWCSRLDAKESWNVDKLDLEMENKQWTFYIHPNSRDKYKTTQSGSGDNSLAQITGTTDIKHEDKLLNETGGHSTNDNNKELLYVK